MLDQAKARAACDQAMQDFAHTAGRPDAAPYKDMCARMGDAWKDPTTPC